jgi:hypothetical protein
MTASNLQRRREHERALQETQSFLSNHNNIQRLQDWEQRTQQRIDQHKVDSIAQHLLQQEEEALQNRKQELHSLYNNDMLHWNETREEVLTASKQQKMEQLRARAYELKARREMERQTFANECYERQWMESCDDLRALNSKALLDRLTKDRELIIKNKKRISGKQPKCQDLKGNIASPSLTAKEDHGGNNEQKRQSSLEFKRALDHQIQLKRSNEESLMRSKQLQEQEQLQQLALLHEQEKQSQRELIDKAKRDGAEMLREMNQRTKEHETRQTIERKQNRLLLEHVMEEERRQTQIEQAKKELGRECASDFMQCLQVQAKEDERENDYIDRILNTEVERLTKVNDEKRAAEVESRRQWMKEVRYCNFMLVEIKGYLQFIRHVHRYNSFDATRYFLHPQMDASWKEQIRRKQIEAENLRNVMEREFVDVQTALRREAEAEAADLEKAKMKRIEIMMDHKQRIDLRLAERKSEHQEQIRNEEECYQQYQGVREEGRCSCLPAAPLSLP